MVTFNDNYLYSGNTHRHLHLTFSYNTMTMAGEKGYGGYNGDSIKYRETTKTVAMSPTLQKMRYVFYSKCYTKGPTNSNIENKSKSHHQVHGIG